MGSTPTLKPGANITRSPKQGYQWSHIKELCPPNNFNRKKLLPNYHLKHNLVSLHYKVETGQPNLNLDSLRITSGTLGWCLVVFCATYTGNLIASLTGTPLLFLTILNWAINSSEEKKHVFIFTKNGGR